MKFDFQIFYFLRKILFFKQDIDYKQHDNTQVTY